MKRFLNRCGLYREGICLLASGVLPEPEKVEVENHLAACAGCRQYYDELKLVTGPIANWEKNFAHIEPDQALQMRWAKAIRAAVGPKPNGRLTPKFVFRALWCELIWPCRHAWAGMAALWLVMWGINLGLSDTQQTAMGAQPASAPAMVQAMEEQRRILAELIPPANAQPAEPPRRNPQPRSDRRIEIVTV